MVERDALRDEIGRLEQGMQAQQALLDRALQLQEESSVELAATKDKLVELLPASCTPTQVRMHALFLNRVLCIGFQGKRTPNNLASC